MIKSFSGRQFAGIKCGVYRNLNTGEWSVKALEGPDKGKKVAEGDSLTLTGCTPFVRDSTRRRLVDAKANPGTGKGSQGFREVHAWIVGYVLQDDVIEHRAGDDRVTYRPFDRPDFFYVDSGDSFTGADTLTFSTGGEVFVVGA